MRVRDQYELLAESRGRTVNCLTGLALYENLLSPAEQQAMVERCVAWKNAGHAVRPCLVAVKLV